MIINGSSRGGPKDLAAHLHRVDTNERVEVMELQSPAGSLREAFRDWQALSGMTRGRLGLYHANIDPAEQYRMSPEQWARAVIVLETELGLTGQPRAVVLHEKHGRQHIHVVWARTDLDTCKLRSDSHNYQAHERASLRLEQEFGHELVPGKHAKRDRERQPDMPSATVRHEEWQQGEGAKLDHTARRAQIGELYQASDSGPAFKAAVENAGYVLARGDSRDFVLLDAEAKVRSLGRELKGVRAADLRAFMAGVDPEALPSVKEARAAIRAAPPPVERAPEPMPEPGLSAPEPQPLPVEDQREADRLRLDTLREKLAAQHGAALAEQERRHGEEITALQTDQQARATLAIDSFATEQACRAVRGKPEQPEGFERMWRAIREYVSEEAKAERLAAECKKARAAEAQRQDEVTIMVGQMNAGHRAEIDALLARQTQERADLLESQAREAQSRVEEEQRVIALEREYARRRQEAEARAREGPDGDTRAR